jgi:spore coat polysaccharide biosynthesis protein SpsF (cytidylyltransferase family)
VIVIEDKDFSIKIVIQARMGSSRFPGKVLKPFWDRKTILDVMLDEILSVVPETEAVIATSDSLTDDVIVERYSDRVAIVRGDERDVLARFIKAIGQTNADGVVRICSDNPFLLGSGLSALLDVARRERPEYAGFLVSGKPSILTHCGLFAEFASADALRRADQLCDDLRIREHVTNYIYLNPDKFRLLWIDDYNSVPNLGSVRLTVDRREDFEIARELYTKLIDSGNRISLQSVMTLLNNEPKWFSMMEKNIALNQK